MQFDTGDQEDPSLRSKPARGALAVATIFKGTALFVLFLGTLASIGTGAVLAYTSIGAARALLIAIGAEVAAVLGAASFSFYGYVLELLVDIRYNTDDLADHGQLREGPIPDN